LPARHYFACLEPLRAVLVEAPFVGDHYFLARGTEPLEELAARRSGQVEAQEHEAIGPEIELEGGEDLATRPPSRRPEAEDLKKREVGRVWGF
jgi:hypothetical protein